MSNNKISNRDYRDDIIQELTEMISEFQAKLAELRKFNET